ncbi:uncharacterized protein LOC131930099 [Physella acuta]|uniref:uncharacterized protein LOC131930099 n=1 Tax=Physella acuta TaxID=109671 RepID=UPI0027DB067E|nr:uncharacterized protein LOC131930099 [Physella acuta]
MIFSKTATVLIIIYLRITSVNLCVPAEEGTEYVLTTTVLNIQGHSQWNWSRNEEVVGSCDSNSQTCNTYSQDFKITVEYLNNNRFKSKLEIYNVTRVSPLFAESVWRFMDARNTELFLCDLKVYSRWTQPVCSLVIGADGLNMTCSLAKIYPSSSCHRELFIDEVENYNLDRLVVYNEAIAHTMPVYYNSWCSLFISVDRLRRGVYITRLFMKPNFANSYFHQSLVHQTTYKTLIDNPLVYTEVNYTVQNSGVFMLNCACKFAASSGEINSTIRWYHRRSNGIQSINSSVISVDMEENVEDYYCQAINVIGMQSSETQCKTSHKYNTTACPKFSKYQNISKELGETASFEFCLPTVFKITEVYIDDYLFLINKTKGNIHIRLTEDKNVQSLTIVVSNLTKHDFKRYVVQMKFISSSGVTTSFTISKDYSTQAGGHNSLLLQTVGSVSLVVVLILSIMILIYCVKAKGRTCLTMTRAGVKQPHIYSVPSDSHLYMAAQSTDTRKDESDSESYIDIDGKEPDLDYNRYNYYIVETRDGSPIKTIRDNNNISIPDYEYVPLRSSQTLHEEYTGTLDSYSLHSE